MADRYFQIQLQASSTLATYQPLCIRGGADAGLDGAILFPAVGERWITLPGDPETLKISLLAADQDQEAPSPVADVRRDRSARQRRGRGPLGLGPLPAMRSAAFRDLPAG